MPHYDFSHVSRREALRVFSGAALVFFGGRFAFAQDAPADAVSTYSTLTPELTEGPYYIDLERIRRDITEGKTGVPLRLRFEVAHVATGAPIPDAAVDVWHCDAQGVYSGFDNHHGPPGMRGGEGDGPSPSPDDANRPPPGPPPGEDVHGPGFPHDHKPDNNETFLRGVQITDAMGRTEIDTIYPGWYQGRTTHIHVRVHLGGSTSDGRYRGGHISHTGQIFFPEDITTTVYQLPSYLRQEQGRQTPEQDGIYHQGGSHSMARLSLIDPQQPVLGYFGDVLLVIEPTATPTRH